MCQQNQYLPGSLCLDLERRSGERSEGHQRAERCEQIRTHVTQLVGSLWQGPVIASDGC